MLINVICIAIIFTIATDELHFWEELSPYIKKLLTNGKMFSPIRFKLFECSTCQTHWVCLFYLLLTHQFTILNYTIILFISFMTPVIMTMLSLIKHIILFILNKIGLWLDI